MSKKQMISNIILILAITILVGIVIFSLEDFGSVINVIKYTKYQYILIALGLLIVYFLLWPLTVIILTRLRTKEIKRRDIFLIGSTEHFFNGITPFSSGGQPFEVYAFSQKGIKARDSTGILMMNFISFMIATNTFAIASLFFYKSFMSKMSNFAAVTIIGFSMNFLVLVIIFLFGISKKFSSLIVKLAKLFAKIKPLKKLIESKIPLLEEYIDGVQEAFKNLMKHKFHFLLCYLINVVKMAVYYAIPFFILLSLNVDVGINDLTYVMLGTSFATTMVVFLPTPGSSGGIEFAFKSIFASLGVDSIVATSGMLLWRAITFFFPLVLSFICYMIFVGKLKRENKNKKEEVEVV